MAAANKINMEIFTPALIFSVLSGKDFELTQFGSLTVGGIVVVLGSGVIAWLVAKAMGYQVKTFVPPVMFTNSGNMGLPLALFAFGKAALPAAVVLFVIENTLHFTVGRKMMDRHASLIGIFRFPMLLATIAGLSVAILNIEVPVLLARPIDMVGQVAIPLMLFSLGVRLLSVNYSDWHIGVVAAIVTPVSGLVMAAIYLQFFALPESQIALFILFAALPPAVLNFIVAEQFDQEPARVASIVMMGNLGSVIVIPLVLVYVL